MTKVMLDIIVPHYNEPWEVWHKFFDMLALQRDVNFWQIRVILVNDGPEYHIPDTQFVDYPYEVDQIDIDHAGVSAARNAGLEHSDAEWVCFCDCDDMFADVYALRSVLDLMPAPNCDILWAELYAEFLNKDGRMSVFKRGNNLTFIHAKFFRRTFLMKNNLRFSTSLAFDEDSAFNAIVSTVVKFQRIGKIKTPAPIYIWTYREHSVTAEYENRYKSTIGHYERNKLVCEAYKERLPHDRYCAMVARTMFDAYYALNVDPLPEELRGMMDDFMTFYREHKDEFFTVDKKMLRALKEVSQKEYRTAIRERSENRGIDCDRDYVDEGVSVTAWLKSLEEDA